MTTRAAVMYDFMTPLTVQTVTVKDPRPDEVVVKVAASGVCRTDLSVIEAHLPYPPPVVLGHEGAGVVEAVGSAVRHLQPGDHVVMSGVARCGHCHYCQSGRAHLCPAGIEAAMAGEEFVWEREGVDIARFAGVGSFAERTVVRASAVIKIPDDVPLTRACLLGCAVITGVGAVINTARVRPGQTVAVFGCGGVGQNIVQGAAIAGAGRIIAIDTLDGKLEVARKLGATDTINAGEVEEIPEAVAALTGGLGVDFAFEAIGVPSVINQAFMSLKRGGKALVVGVAPFGVEVSVPACLFSLEERSLVGSLFGSTDIGRDVPRLIELYRRKRLDLDTLVTRELPLESINEAFDAMKSGDAVRSVIVFD